MKKIVALAAVVVAAQIGTAMAFDAFSPLGPVSPLNPASPASPIYQHEAERIRKAETADPSKIDLAPIALVPVPNDDRCQYVIFNAGHNDGTVDGQRFENGRCVPAGKPVPLSKVPCRLGDKEGTQQVFLDSKGRKVITTQCGW